MGPFPAFFMFIGTCMAAAPGILPALLWNSFRNNQVALKMVECSYRAFQGQLYVAQLGEPFNECANMVHHFAKGLCSTVEQLNWSRTFPYPDQTSQIKRYTEGILDLEIVMSVKTKNLINQKSFALTGDYGRDIQKCLQRDLENLFFVASFSGADFKWWLKIVQCQTACLYESIVLAANANIFFGVDDLADWFKIVQKFTAVFRAKTYLIARTVTCKSAQFHHSKRFKPVQSRSTGWTLDMVKNALAFYGIPDSAPIPPKSNATRQESFIVKYTIHEYPLIPSARISNYGLPDPLMNISDSFTYPSMLEWLRWTRFVAAFMESERLLLAFELTASQHAGKLNQMALFEKKAIESKKRVLDFMNLRDQNTLQSRLAVGTFLIYSLNMHHSLLLQLRHQCLYEFSKNSKTSSIHCI